MYISYFANMVISHYRSGSNTVRVNTDTAFANKGKTSCQERTNSWPCDTLIHPFNDFQ